MKVLIACEFSGTVRDAFIKRGHDAVSCDILPTDKPGPHYQCDVREIIGNGWDLMIAHPPCRYLSAAGLHWNYRRPERKAKTEAAFQFFLDLYGAPIDKICVENPVGYVNTHLCPPTQIINPFMFGHPERKRTCLWLKGLHPLIPTNVVEPEQPTYVDKSGKKRYFTDKLSPSEDRWKIRSVTFQGIADAMAEQWG